METEKTIEHSISFNLKSKLADYAALAKLRLASLVVYSAGLGYGIALLTAEVFPLAHKMDYSFSWQTFLFIILGGFLVTGSSNGFNQVIERDSDAKMNRTKNRPIPAGRMSVNEGLIVSSIMGIIGLFLLYKINNITFALGLIALISYVVIYTPLKKITPISVFVGAFPGSIPPMIGYIAASGEFGFEPGMIFLVQFVWQFPHFWAIAWKGSEDYASGGYKMLPFGDDKDIRTAFIILFYTLFVIPAGMLPWVFHVSGLTSMILSIILGIYFIRPAIKLYKSLEDKDALKLMFASFSYLPLIFLFYYLDLLIQVYFIN
ncbi:heme o synthase [Flavobacteriales bacterium]|nr:heme o synthase [Flavobacteriales bacterium]MDB4088913.1 heme o synthase [Flavobacteriales bacterium]